MLLVVVAWSASDDNKISYILLVLWITLFAHSGMWLSLLKMTHQTVEQSSLPTTYAQSDLSGGSTREVKS